MTAQLQSPWIQIIDLNGEPVSGAKIRVYAPTTTTPMDVFSDTFLTVPVEQPIIADAAGRILRLYVAGPYKIRIEDSEGELIVERDNQDPALPNGFGGVDLVPVASGGTGAPNAAAARANLGAASADSVTQLTQTVADNQNALGDLAVLDAVGRDELEAGFGQILIQRVRHETVVDSTITTTTPAYDSSKPQISEGDQVFSLSFTPLSASSTIRIKVFITGDNTAAAYILAAVFKNSDADAIAADAGFVPTISTPATVQVFHEEASGSTSARTYSVRAGVAAGTFTINGAGTFGGLRKSHLLIEEWVSV